MYGNSEKRNQKRYGWQLLATWRRFHSSEAASNICHVRRVTEKRIPLESEICGELRLMASIALVRASTSEWIPCFKPISDSRSYLLLPSMSLKRHMRRNPDSFEAYIRTNGGGLYYFAEGVHFGLLQKGSNVHLLHLSSYLTLLP